MYVYVWQFHTPSGREEVWCVAYPWCEGGEVVRVKVEKMGDSSQQRQVALEPAEGTMGLFGWNTITPDAKEVYILISEAATLFTRLFRVASLTATLFVCLFCGVLLTITLLYSCPTLPH